MGRTSPRRSVPGWCRRCCCTSETTTVTGSTSSTPRSRTSAPSATTTAAGLTTSECQGDAPTLSQRDGYGQSARRCCLVTDAGAGTAPIARRADARSSCGAGVRGLNSATFVYWRKEECAAWVRDGENCDGDVVAAIRLTTTGGGNRVPRRGGSGGGRLGARRRSRGPAKDTLSGAAAGHRSSDRDVDVPRRTRSGRRSCRGPRRDG